MKRLSTSFLGCALCLSNLAAWGQSTKPSADQAPAPTIHATTQEVVLDMVFSDKKGKPIRDIKPEEIHVAGEGPDQTLPAFQLVEGPPPRPAGTSDPATAQPLDPMR